MWKYYVQDTVNIIQLGLLTVVLKVLVLYFKVSQLYKKLLHLYFNVFGPSEGRALPLGVAKGT